MTGLDSRKQKWLVSALLAAAVLAVFSPALRCGFVNYDDPAYVTDNWQVQKGLTLAGFRWAFATAAASNWHPLTWLSHMLDVQCYGMAPMGHHLSSLLLHAANAVLLFLLLNRLTGALPTAAFIAAMFALDPLRVESVAWISERKDVLSAFFWLLSVGAYLRYAENLKPRISYALALLFFMLALMSKPMAVSLPFVLLLLDYWPLGRKFSWPLIREKIPFFVLAAVCGVVTFLAQDQSEAVASLARFPLGIRLENIPVAYVRYLTKTFWPMRLAAFYPYTPWSLGAVIGAMLLLGSITACVIWRRKERPYLVVGWFWFLGMLVPAIGLVQVGGQSLADRYTYLPGIGLWIMLAWGLRGLRREALTVAAAAALMFFAALTWRQTKVYQDSGTLWQATLRSYPDCLAAHNNLAKWLIAQGRWDDAAANCRETLAILPADPEAHNNLSAIYLRQGRADDAIAEALKSIQAQPRSADNRQSLARAYLRKGDFPAAAAAFHEAIIIDSKSSEAWCNLGYALLRQGKVPDAATAYQRALDLNPGYALAHNDLGNILLREGRPDEALEHFQRAVEFAPEFAEAHYNLSGILARRGQLAEAIAHCRKAVDLQPSLSAARERLAALIAAQDKSAGH